MLFVSYGIVANDQQFGFGNINMIMDGIFSTEDVLKVTEYINDVNRKEGLDNSKIIILNWRKYDLPL